MPQKEQRFVVVDPTTMDGDPFDVAERSARQAAGVAAVLAECVSAAKKMARNAQLSRNLQADPDNPGTPEEWENDAIARSFSEIDETAHHLEKKLLALAKAASYNPKSRRSS